MSALPARRTYLCRTFFDYKRSAKRRDIEWDLTFEEFAAVCAANCAYCGCEAKPRAFNKRSNGTMKPSISVENINGIDRIDNALGYTVLNSAPCCTVCNRAKASMSVADFLDHCLRVVNKMRLK